MSEFELIDKYCSNLGCEHPETILSVGDDAAIVSVPDGYELAVSVDTSVEGTHFLKGLSPELIAHKSLAVNLSDMAAMGAIPKWVTVATTQPEFNEDWTAKFTSTLHQVATLYGVQVIGGDSTEGPLSITISIMGLLPAGKGLRRDQAQVGDLVYCSGELGDAALALTKLLGEQDLDDEIFTATLPALHLPKPQVTLGQRLLGVVNSCIDLSDGLIGDAVHIAGRSNVSIEIETNKLPLSEAYKRYVEGGGFIRYALAGGDDYQLMFTAGRDKEDDIQRIANDLDVKITEIGRVVAPGKERVVTLQDGVPTTIKLKPYQHFL